MDNRDLIQMSLEALPNFVIVDVEGNIVYINRVYTELLGIRQEDAIGRPAKEIIPGTKLPEILMTYQHHIGEIMRFADHRTGETVELVCNRFPLIKDGEAVGAMAVTTFESLTEINHLYAELDRVKEENQKYKAAVAELSDPMRKIAGISDSILEIKRTIADFAGSNLTMLLTGETGVGKEVFATAIHELSTRKFGSFVKINCAAIPRDLLESELFGYEEGAFTGAKKSGKAGMFELADGGTLLLDEIGEMSLDLQSKLLRVLQEREIMRVGGSKPKAVSVRVICSTNRNLQEMVYEGKFREDLYYRINTVEIPIPPLRERLDDLPILCDFLIRKINGQYQINCLGPDDEVLELFRQYSWPGNVRELEHTLERLAFLNQYGKITLRHCDFLKKRLREDQPGSRKPPAADLHQRREQAEMEAIRQALREANGNKSRAAEILGLSRSMLYKKLRNYDL